MEFVTNFGQTKSKKIITIIGLTKSDNSIIGGTCHLTRNEIYDVIDDCKREINMRDKKLIESTK